LAGGDRGVNSSRALLTFVWPKPSSRDKFLEKHGVEIFNHGSLETLAASIASAYAAKEAFTSSAQCADSERLVTRAPWGLHRPMLAARRWNDRSKVRGAQQMAQNEDCCSGPLDKRRHPHAQGALESKDSGHGGRQALKRTEAAVRQKAKTVGLGHRR
jgi:hypothetical protein